MATVTQCVASLHLGPEQGTSWPGWSPGPGEQEPKPGHWRNASVKQTGTGRPETWSGQVEKVFRYLALHTPLALLFITSVSVYAYPVFWGELINQGYRLTPLTTHLWLFMW